jgi:hypothetical protein
MIVGLQMDFTTDELKAHFTAKAEEHEAKAEAYGKQIKGLNEINDPESQNSNDPRRGLGDSRRNHAMKAQRYRILADHLVPSEIYRLSNADLMEIGMIERGW